MDQKMKKILKTGFLLSRYGIDAFYSALLFIILWLILILANNSVNFDMFGFIAFVFIIIGLILFFIGRIIVGLQSRKLNLYMNRSRTIEEEWFLQQMIGLEQTAILQNLANQFAKISPNNADNILFASSSCGIIKRYFAVGRIYMGDNVFVNRIILILSSIVVLIMFAINFI